MDPGTAIRCETSKWGDRPHWQFEGFFLGSDEHGDWIGVPQGTHHRRPGLEFHSDVDAVTLVPSEGWYAATFHQPGIWCDLYIDVSTPANWDGDVLRTVDLDLDVIRRDTGEVFIDDEDEFLEHQVSFGYPADVVAAARASADELKVAVAAGASPYDGKAHLRWLDHLTSMRTSPQ